ncbi:hypothetical protein Y017_07425 [Alcanivorax sp. 97CO-5]|jgi:hypothetical protein|uniref:hypothetical protein n=1 Tax=Alcanivorax TaxID=59753 RepID=UPI0003E80436|nr:MULTISPECIES: hypothetical protein [unclassified Alcanivorax]EUC71077.1 hypothetical protein Y017_07425 [Alcanivorax sp. 97CO-5]PKG02334.1 hypothetical protein Y019_03240 [Alcanivorax sp. 97CO-6]BAP15625.1 hypothetical protein AS19_27740 [Alcanivorax sp. NBRC 101098]
MGIKDCFAKYGATLKNVNWSVSAENTEGELVVSLWNQFFTPPTNGKISYIDKVNRWSGHGNAEFRERIQKAYATNQPVRVVIARTNDENAIRRGDDASKLKNQFHVREDWVGKVTLWDGDNFEIEFSSK